MTRVLAPLIAVTFATIGVVIAVRLNRRFAPLHSSPPPVATGVEFQCGFAFYRPSRLLTHYPLAGVQVGSDELLILTGPSNALTGTSEEASAFRIAQAGSTVRHTSRPEGFRVTSDEVDVLIRVGGNGKRFRTALVENGWTVDHSDLPDSP